MTGNLDESTLTKGQLRKLQALCKSVGPEIGERAFTEWLASQANVEKTDKNIEAIETALWPLVQQGRLNIRRGGYLVRRGRGRIIVEPVEPAPAPIEARDRYRVQDVGAQKEDLEGQRGSPHQSVVDRKEEAQSKRLTWRGLFGGGKAGVA